MKTTPAALRALALFVLLAAAPRARADLVHWSYTWSRSPGDIPADAPGTGKISLTDEGLTNVVGDSDIVATNLRTYSTAPDDQPDRYTNKAYTLSLNLVDQASGQGGTISFTGLFNGTVSAHSANVTNTFTSPTTQSLDLGRYRYTAKLDYFTPPGPPSAANYGGISAHVSVSVALIASLPEPNALALAGLGVALVGLARARRRRLPLRPA